MSSPEYSLVLFGIALFAGLLGALLGLGGGFVVVPALTLVLGLDIRVAIGASVIAVVATSSGAAAAYVRDRLTNLRVAMVLEIATTTGAITGGYLGGVLPTGVLYVVFGSVLIVSAAGMLRNRNDEHPDVSPDRAAQTLRLGSAYRDAGSGEVISYEVTHVPAGAALMYVAGTVSGLLGIGGGVLKVPSMDLAMRLPIKVSTATSNFMIGVTAAASAAVYYGRGDIKPFIAGPVALGVIVGALGGSRLLPQVQNRVVRVIFVATILLTAVDMLRSGL